MKGPNVTIHQTHTDIGTGPTLRGIPKVNTTAATSSTGMHWDPHFDRALKVFKDAKPQGSDQHSMNQVNDYRSVASDVNIHIAGELPVEKTQHVLARPKMADVIRNTSSYVS